jgi:hypothetical protein
VLVAITKGAQMIDGVGFREEFISVRARLYSLVFLSDCIGDSHVKCFLDWSRIMCTKVCPTGLV